MSVLTINLPSVKSAALQITHVSGKRRKVTYRFGSGTRVLLGWIDRLTDGAYVWSNINGGYGVTDTEREAVEAMKLDYLGF